MSNTNPTTHDEMREYVRIRLGHPVIEVNVPDVQMDVQIRRALDLYNEVHYNSSDERILAHKVTAANVTAGFIQFDASHHQIIEIFTHQAAISKTQSSNVFNLSLANSGTSFSFSSYLPQSQFDTADIQVGAGYPLQLYLLDMSIADNQFYFERQPEFEFNLNNKKLFIYETNGLVEDNYVIYRAHLLHEYTDNAVVWVDNWLKEYCVACVQEQWGLNLIKFRGASLYGEGVELNADAILSEAKEKLQALETDLQEQYQGQPPIIIG